MAKFTFQFQTLLEHRQRTEDVRKREVAQLQQQRQRLIGQLTETQNTIRQSKQDLSQALVGQVDFSAVGSFTRYAADMENQGRFVLQNIAALEGQISQARSKLLEAVKQRKALELLRDRYKDRWQREQDSRETAELDEIATQKFIRDTQEVTQ